MARYFKDKEMACKCSKCEGKINVGKGINSKLYEVLDKIRETLGKPVFVLSGYRCPEHNEAVGGVPNSQHVRGIAADITYEGIDVDDLAKIAKKAGADGIGRYPTKNFVHVDVRGHSARWLG